MFLYGLQPTPPVPKGFVWGRILARDEAVSTAAIMDDVAYVAISDGRLRALRLNDGESLWTYDPGFVGYASPVVTPDHVYHATADGRLHIVSRSEGRLVHSLKLEGKPSGQIVVTERAVYVRTAQPSALVAVR